MAKRRFDLSREEVAAVRAFLDAREFQGPPPINATGFTGITREQYWESYQSWARGGHGWRALHSGGTTTMGALCWYQHIHRPGSKEWRPSIIIRALLDAVRPALALPIEEKP